jgi:hypothetical protein
LQVFLVLEEEEVEKCQKKYRGAKKDQNRGLKSCGLKNQDQNHGLKNNLAILFLVFFCFFSVCSFIIFISFHLLQFISFHLLQFILLKIDIYIFLIIGYLNIHTIK